MPFFYRCKFHVAFDMTIEDVLRVCFARSAKEEIEHFYFLITTFPTNPMMTSLAPKFFFFSSGLVYRILIIL